MKFCLIWVIEILWWNNVGGKTYPSQNQSKNVTHNPLQIFDYIGWPESNHSLVFASFNLA